MEHRPLINELPPTTESGSAAAAGVIAGQQKLADATQAVVQSVQHDEAETQLRLGLQYYSAGEMSAALRHLAKAADLDPHNATVQFNLATLLYEEGALEPARAAYERCIAIESRHFKARNNLGAILRAGGDRSGAVDQFRIAWQAAPQSLEVGQNLAGTLFDCEQFDEATSIYRAVAERHPHDQPARLGWAASLEQQGQVQPAYKLLTKLSETRPHDLLINLRRDLTGRTVFDTRKAFSDFRVSLTRAVARYEAEPFSLSEEEIPHSGCKPPVSLAYYGGNLLRCHRALARAVARHVQTEPAKIPTGKPRVGFLATARHEPVFLRGMAELIRRLNADRFDIYVIVSAAGEKLAQQSLRSETVRVVTLPESFSEMLATLRELKLDVLNFWEIGTDPTNYFLPFYRTAPVQCASWGWPVTSGIKGVDYFLSSELLETPQAASHYTEELIRFARLPNVYLRPADKQLRWSRESFGFGSDEHIYFCPQNPLKITPDLDALFVRILQQDPTGRLLLLAGRDPHVAERLHQRISEPAPEVADRLQFVPRASGDQYRSLLHAADVLLDTLHYSGGANTNCDALVLGQPVVTWPSEFHRGRYTQAMYRQLGVTDTVVDSADEYVKMALRLASEPEFGHDVGQRLVAASELVFEDRSAVARMETFLDGAIAESRARG